jgi:transcriptional regulator GlxA family with amidase domain
LLDRSRDFEDVLRIGVIAPNGCRSFDIMTPIDAFNEANRLTRSARRYKVELIGVHAGAIVASTGVRMLPDRIIGPDLGEFDTILIAGSPDGYPGIQDRTLLDWLVKAARSARRVGAIYNGVFALAAAGLLNGRRVATHWHSAKHLAAMFPDILVEPDCLFLRDGAFYTAAGVTAGIDLCLDLIEHDLGYATSVAVARMLVIFLRRPGGQSQISEFLKAQSVTNTQVAEALQWALENLNGDLSVDSLARHAAMSTRNFRRAFQIEMGTTPSRYVELARVEAASLLLETSPLSMQQIAYRVGFDTPGNMRRVFLRIRGISPADYRQRFPWQQQRERVQASRQVVPLIT